MTWLWWQMGWTLHNSPTQKAQRCRPFDHKIFALMINAVFQPHITRIDPIFYISAISDGAYNQSTQQKKSNPSFGLFDLSLFFCPPADLLAFYINSTWLMWLSPLCLYRSCYVWGHLYLQRRANYPGKAKRSSALPTLLSHHSPPLLLDQTPQHIISKSIVKFIWHNNPIYNTYFDIIILFLPTKKKQQKNNNNNF